MQPWKVFFFFPTLPLASISGPSGDWLVPLLVLHAVRALLVQALQAQALQARPYRSGMKSSKKN